MCVIGVTVVIQFEENRIRQQEVEVKALTALVEQNVILSMRIDAVKRLHEIAFPDKLVEEINEQSDLSDLFGDDA